MCYQYHKKHDRQILIPKRPEEGERKQIKRIDLRPNGKKNIELHISVVGISKTSGTQPHRETILRRKHRWKPTKIRIHGLFLSQKANNNQGTWRIPVYSGTKLSRLTNRRNSGRYVRINRVTENLAVRNKKTSYRWNWILC